MAKRSSRLMAGSPPLADVAAAKRLASAFRAMSAGLVNIHSESTSTEHTYRRFVAEVDPTALLTSATVAAALRIGPRYHVDLQSAEGRLDASEWGDEQAVGYRLLEQLMRATLGDLFIAYARGPGVVQVRTFVFGRLDGRFLVGLRAITVET